MARDHRALQAALLEIDQSLVENIDRSKEIRRRVVKLHKAIESGKDVRGFIESEPEPRAVELLTANLGILEQAGADFRINLAMALREEGMTIQAIADLFGVTRQRISALLRQNPNS